MYDVKLNVLNRDSYKKLKNFDIVYGAYETRFGKCFVGMHESDLCYLTFKSAEEEQSDPIETDLKSCFPGAFLTEDQKAIAEFADRLFEDEDKETKVAVRVLLLGTEFQLSVWRALVDVKSGSTTSYEDVAKSIGRPSAVRAVANAIAGNKVAYIVPCHRVIRKNGRCVGKAYRWGVERKVEMLRFEGAISD